MIAGLLFAREDAVDRPEMLAATLPFSGGTLIEYQARLLLAAGAAQIIVVVTRTTPELVGAVNRIARRGVPIDAVRTAAEALEKVHPLATIVMLADGLITTDAILHAVAEGEGDALLVIDEPHGDDHLERVDASSFWAGIARFGPPRLAEAARMPDEYDLQSTLLRAVVQARAVRLVLPPDAMHDGHGVERNAGGLVRRGRRALGARLATRRPWIDRFVLGPIARWLLPPLADRRLPARAPLAVGGVLGLIGWALLTMRWSATGLLLAVLAAIAFALGEGLCWLVGDERGARWQRSAIGVVGAVAAAILGLTLSRDTGTATGWFAAAVLLVAAVLVERTAPDRLRPSWWGSPAAYLLLVWIATLAHQPLAGLMLVTGYAAASLAAAIERASPKP